ncbi:MAG: LUD domain-containing protein [Desulfobulbus sp.]|jgi:hypothetical protein
MSVDIENHWQLRLDRCALHCDLFFAGSNAVTADGKLVMPDMVGNRTAAITFGPRHVVICVGNKLTAKVVSAMERIKNYAVPLMPSATST